ncbi:MAG TPA: sigma-70 family RNA polymerase sigma factor [Terracidiphilus sp.]|nr:sigma-70 family RNA polymerase sigma factor [Terracidiphilus sp.]
MDETRLSVNELAKACAESSEAEEWAEFLCRSVPIATVVAVRVCRMWMGRVAPSVVDDIVQEIFLKLCEAERRILRKFVPQGEDSFFGLLRVVSLSVANDHFRRLYSAKRGGKVVTVALEDTTPRAAAQSSGLSLQKIVLLAEMDRKLRSAPDIVPERDRAMFWMYYLQGLTSEEIAALPAIGLSAKGVESAMRRVTTWLRREMTPQNSNPQGKPATEPGRTT